MTVELKPCPFCGGTDSEDNATQQAGLYLVSFKSAIGKTAYRVECQCGVMGPSDLDQRVAATSWNRRAPSTLEAELEKAREALERIAAYGTVAGMHDHDRDSVLRNIARAALSHNEG